MSLLLQLLDRFRDFDQAVLATLVDELVPEYIVSILSVFGRLVSLLPSTVLVVLIVDGRKVLRTSDGTAEGHLAGSRGAGCCLSQRPKTGFQFRNVGTTPRGIATRVRVVIQPAPG